MPDLSPTAFNVVITLVGILLYLFLWRATRDFPSAAKIFARLALALVAIVPLVLATMIGTERKAVRRDEAPRPRMTQAEPPAKSAEAPSRQLESAAPRPSAPSAGAPAPAAPAPAAPPPVATAPAPAPAAPTAARPAPITAPTPPPVAAAPPAAPAPGAAAPGAAAPASEEKSATGAGAPPLGATRGAGTPAGEGPWDIVPVYFGTDRSRDGAAGRVGYTADRGKRLELGQALVTVPKKHEVPQLERPWVYRIPFTGVVIHQEKEDPRLHFTMKDIQVLSKDDLLKAVKARLDASSTFKGHALVFIHGFNTSFDYAVYRTAQIAYDLKFDGAPFSYSWPSKGAFGVQDYAYDRESAQQTEPYLREFLEMVVKESGATSISIIAHSMGNQALFPVLRELKRARPDGVVISQLILAAPDVDRDGFEFLASQFKGIARGTTLFAASNDRAMVASRKFWGNVPRAGDVPEGGPIIVDGIDTIDVTAVNTDVVATNHSGYAEKTALLNDIQLLIQTGERPPNVRIPILEKVGTPKGDYWRYPAAR